MNAIKAINTKKNRGVYRYNMPPNVNLYDDIWENENNLHLQGSAIWGRQKQEKLFSLFGAPVDFSGKTVLDACCGLGRFSIASLELNADSVYAVDGSFEALLALSKREQKIRETSEEQKGKLVPIQCNMDNITEVFNKKSFDIIIHYMALHHMRDYKKTLKDFHTLLNPGGLLAFNFFLPGTNHPSIFALRKVFLEKSLDFTTEFLEKIGKVKGREFKKIHSFKDLISSKKKIDTRFDEVIDSLKNLVKKFGVNAIDNNLHWESLQTPYLNNLNPQEVCQYIEEDLNMSIKYANRDRHCALKPA